MSKGKIVVISGPSGVGKGTVVNSLISKDESFFLSISATTRPPREGEVEGIHYFFIAREDFESKIKNGEMLEYNEYNGNYYGTIKKYVIDKIENGINVVLEIDMNGGSQVKKLFPEAITVFLSAPSFEVIEHRLRKRGTESEEVIQKRLKIAKIEMEKSVYYDYTVCNDEVDNAVNKIIEIVKNN